MYPPVTTKATRQIGNTRAPEIRTVCQSSSSLAVRAWAGSFAGDGEAAQRLCDEATGLVDALSDEELARQPNALARLATADLYLDRFVAARRHARRALEIGRATGQGDLLPEVVAMLGGALWVQGRPLEAEELFDGAVEAARLAGNPSAFFSLVSASLGRRLAEVLRHGIGPTTPAFLFPASLMLCGCGPLLSR